MTAYSESYDREKSREQGSMSFLEHLDELRRRLMHSALFMVVAFMGCWFVSDKIYHFLEVPVRAAIMEAKKMVAVPLADTRRMTLDDLQDGRRLKFIFPTDAKFGDTLVPAGSTVDVQVKRATPNDPPQLVSNDDWFINSQCIIPPGFIIPENLTSPSAIE